jgi:hypothetical protein
VREEKKKRDANYTCFGLLYVRACICILHNTHLSDPNTNDTYIRLTRRMQREMGAETLSLTLTLKPNRSWNGEWNKDTKISDIRSCDTEIDSR